jgi:hypothetical protein
MNSQLDDANPIVDLLPQDRKRPKHLPKLPASIQVPCFRSRFAGIFAEPRGSRSKSLLVR